MKKLYFINDLMNVFIESLLSIMPFIDRIGIKYLHDSKYDGWERISTSLFKSIFTDSVENSYQINEINFVEYGIEYNSYENLSFIKIDNFDTSDYFFAFVEVLFKSQEQIIINVNKIEKKSFNVVEKLEVDLKNFKYSLVYNNNKALTYFEFLEIID